MSRVALAAWVLGVVALGLLILGTVVVESAPWDQKPARFECLWAGLAVGSAAALLGVFAALSPSKPRLDVAIAVLLILLVAAWAVRGTWRRTGFPPAVCLSNMKNIALAMRMYLEDSDGRYPTEERWQASLNLYVRHKMVYVCPVASRGVPSYAHNPLLFEMDSGHLAALDRTILLFESDEPWGPECGDLPATPRHTGGDNYAFADGSARWIARRTFRTDADGKPFWGKEPADDSVIWQPVLKEEGVPDR